MNFYAASRRSARRSLWLVLPHTSHPFVDQISRYIARETSHTRRIASRSSVPSLTSHDRIGSDRNEPARIASFQIRNPFRSFQVPQENFSSQVRSFAAWSGAGASSRPADAEAFEVEAAIFESKSRSKSKPLIAVQAELERRIVKYEKKGDRGGGQSRIKKMERGEKGGGDERVERFVAGNGAGKSEGGKRKNYGRKGCKEEEEAVAVIAGVLREKYGPQIVREELEERGSGIGSSEGEEGLGRLKREEGDDEEEEEVEEEEEAEVEPCEEDAAPTTSPSTPPPPPNRRRVVSRSSLLSLYRFFSSHLSISSPSTVSSLLSTYPQLLRSNPTNDFLPRVRLLQSYGISNADVTHMTLTSPAWLRSSLQRIQNMLEFLLAKGIRRSRLGTVLRRGRNLLCCEARSTNLDILVERAGVPVDKLRVIIEKCPSILTQSKEAVGAQLGTLSSFFKATSGGKVEADSTSTSLLKQQLDEPQSNHLDTRFIATVLWRGPTILNLSTETLLAKLQFFVELMGEEATRRVAQSYPMVLKLSEENLQGKVAALVDLIGRENALRTVAQVPLLLASSDDVMRESFRELVREVEEALTISGEAGNGMQRLGEGDRGNCLEGENYSSAFNPASRVKRCRARRLVVDLVVRYPPSISYSWKTNLKPKVEYLKRDMGLSIMDVLAYPPFLGLSLDRRIRPRHVALVRMGYAVVAREMVSRTSVGAGRDFPIQSGKQGSKLGSVSLLSDEVGGVEGIDWGAGNRKSGRTGDRQEQQCQREHGGSDLPLEELLGDHKPGGRAATEQQLVNLDMQKKMVFLRRFVHCSDKLFEEKFGVTL
ncbi:unnamed protein product [Closterium sp. NIES-54]